MEELIALLKNRKWLLASCESVTGGDFASRLTDISGASEVYAGGYIAYSSASKVNLQLVTDDLLNEFGAVSREAVNRLAIETKKLLKCDIVIAFSGNAGPSASSNQPVGRVYTAIAVFDDCIVYEDDFIGSRKEIKRQIVESGIRRLLNIISKENMR